MEGMELNIKPSLETFWNKLHNSVSRIVKQLKSIRNWKMLPGMATIIRGILWIDRIWHHVSTRIVYHVYTKPHRENSLVAYYERRLEGWSVWNSWLFESCFRAARPDYSKQLALPSCCRSDARMQLKISCPVTLVWATSYKKVDPDTKPLLPLTLFAGFICIPILSKAAKGLPAQSIISWGLNHAVKLIQLHGRSLDGTS